MNRKEDFIDFKWVTYHYKCSICTHEWKANSRFMRCPSCYNEDIYEEIKENQPFCIDCNITLDEIKYSQSGNIIPRCPLCQRDFVKKLVDSVMV